MIALRSMARSASVIAFASLFVFVAGCAPGSSTKAEASPTVSVSASSTPSARATSSTSASASISAAPASAAPASTAQASVDSAAPGAADAQNAGSSTCATAHLAGTFAEIRGSAGASQRFYALTLTNTGTQPCVMTGYPGVSFVAEDGVTQLGAAAERTGEHEAVPVTLNPNESAQADLRMVVAPGPIGGCMKEDQTTLAPKLRVYPPDQTEPLVISAGIQVCKDGSLDRGQVSAMVHQ